jgi:ABC-type Na+ transport system ATPase subunit NatA
VLLHEGRIVDEGTLSELVERAGARNLTDAFLKNIGAGTAAGGDAP